MEHRTPGALAADTHNHHDAAARKPNNLLAPSSSPFSSSFPAPPQQPNDPTPLIKRVQHDLAEALRLHSSPHVQQRLSLLAAQRAWVEQVVQDAVEALASVGAEQAASGEQTVGGEVVEGSDERATRRSGEAVRSDGWRRQWTMVAPRRTMTTTREKEGEGGRDEVRRERVAALAACHASLLSAVAKMQRMEEEGLVVVGGMGEAGLAGKTVGSGGGCDGGGMAAGLPTYESSRNDERVVPWEYRPEGDAILRPSSTRKRFIKSRKDEKPRNVEDLRGVPQQHARAVTLDEAFPYLQAFFKAIPEDTRVDAPAELPVELPAEVPLDRIPTAPQVHVATSSPGLLSPHPASYTQSFDNFRDPQWDRASSKIPCDPAEVTNGSRLLASATSKRRSFRKAKLGETSQGVWETPDSIPNNIGWAP